MQAESPYFPPDSMFKTECPGGYRQLDLDKGTQRKIWVDRAETGNLRSEYVKHILKTLTTRTVISNALALHDSADHSAALSAESSSAAIDKTIELKTAAFPKAILKVTQGAAAFFNRFRQRCPNRTGQFYITRR